MNPYVPCYVLLLAVAIIRWESFAISRLSHGQFGTDLDVERT
jgi:hypothetical protein